MPTPSRRTALVVSGLTLGVVATGCGEGATPPPARTGGRSDGPDETLLGEARTDLVAALALVRAARRAHPSLRPRLVGLQRTHRDQLSVLDPEGRTGPAEGPEVPARAAEALRSVVRAEERLVRRLVTWSVAAESGPLARALAASAAGVAQQLALLEVER